MTDRERLIELIMKARAPLISRPWAEEEADYLIQHGVIVPPCKVGDTVWAIALTGKLYKYTINGFHQFEDKHFMFGAYRIREDGKKVNPTWADIEIGKTVFIGDNAKYEAEKALAERSGK